MFGMLDSLVLYFYTHELTRVPHADLYAHAVALYPCVDTIRVARTEASPQKAEKEKKRERESGMLNYMHSQNLLGSLPLMPVEQRVCGFCSNATPLVLRPVRRTEEEGVKEELKATPLFTTPLGIMRKVV